MRLLYNSRILKNNCVSFSEPVCIDNYITLFEVEPIQEFEEMIDEEEAVLIGNNIVKEANASADQILLEANQEAERIKQNAKMEMEIIKKRTIDEAKSEGFNSGYAEGKETFAGMITKLEEKSQQLDRNYDFLLKSAEEEIIELTKTIARKVVNEEVMIDIVNLRHMVLEGLKICYDKNSAVVKLSKADYDLLFAQMPELVDQIANLSQVEIKCDMSIKDRSCIVETPNGIIDLSMIKKLDKIFQDIEFTTQSK